MTDQRSPSWLAPAGALLMATTALAACERRPYPEPSMAAPPPTAPPPELLGAPEDRDGRPLPPPDAYAPRPDGELPPAPDRPGEPGTYPPPYPAPDAGRGEPAYVPAPPVTMAPIPNPPEDERGGRRASGERERYLRAEGVVPPRPDRVIEGQPVPNPVDQPRAPRRMHRRTEHVRAAPPARVHLHLRPTRPAHHTHRHAPAGGPAHAYPAPKVVGHMRTHAPAAVVHAPKPAAPAHKPSAVAGHAAPAKPHAVAPAPVKLAPAKAAPVHPHIVAPKPAEVIKPKPPATLVKPAAPVIAVPAKPEAAAKPVPVETKGRHHGKLANDAPTAEQSARLATLSGALTPVIAARASLHGADALRPGTPGDVALTVPQDFAEGLRSEATKGGLSDAAASAALTARLAGEGYAVSPADGQSQPLLAGKPTEFRWTVTRMDAAKGPLTAEVGADLLGGGKQHLDLGTLTASSTPRAGVSPKAVGVGILALIAVLVAFIMMGGRRREDPVTRT